MRLSTSALAEPQPTVIDKSGQVLLFFARLRCTTPPSILTDFSNQLPAFAISVAERLISLPLVYECAQYGDLPQPIALTVNNSGSLEFPSDPKFHSKNLHDECEGNTSLKPSNFGQNSNPGFGKKMSPCKNITAANRWMKPSSGKAPETNLEPN